MEVTQLSGYWAREFTRLAEGRTEKDRLAQSVKQEREKDKEETEAEKKRDDDFADLIQAYELATPTQLADFEVKLDSYDRVTVEALMEKTKELEAVQKRMAPMLEEAYVLPDGRRVFRNRDGTEVHDEHGVKLDAKVINPTEISEAHPFWEDYKPLLDQKNSLTKDIDGLLEYQEKLDNARERMRSDKPLTESELKAIEQDLEKTMPDDVKRGIGKKPDAQIDTEISMNELSMMAETAPSHPTAKAKMLMPT